MSGLRLLDGRERPHILLGGISVMYAVPHAIVVYVTVSWFSAACTLTVFMKCAVRIVRLGFDVPHRSQPIQTDDKLKCNHQQAETS